MVEIEEVGAEPIAKTLDIPLEKAQKMVEIAHSYLEEKAAEQKKRAKERAAKKADEDSAQSQEGAPVAADEPALAEAAPDGAGGEGPSAEAQEQVST